MRAHALWQFVLAPMLLLPGCQPSSPLEAAKAADVPEESLEPLGITCFSDSVVLYLEYPRLIVGKEAKFLAHLSERRTGEPIRSGQVVIEEDVPGGARRLVANGPKREGLFTPTGTFDRPGKLSAHLILESDEAHARLELGEFVVHPDFAAAKAAAEAEASEAPVPGATPFLMEQQWRVKLLVEQAGPRTLTRRLIVPAQVRTPEGAEAVVSSPVAGRLLERSDAALPKTGDTVDVGKLIADVEPPLGAAEIAQLQALRLELDLKTLDIVRALSEAQAHVDFAQRERERMARLREHGLSTQQALDEVERDLRIAQSELEGAAATKKSLDRLLEQRAAQTGDASSLAVRLPIMAPLHGIIVAAPKLPGAFIEPGEEIFRILDTSRVWIEGRISEFDLHLLVGEPAAIATFDALPGKRVEVGRVGRPLQLLPLFDATSRTAVLRCEVSNADGAMKAGMIGNLEIATESVAAKVVVPAEAIVIDQSLPTAYVMLEGELFQKRELEIGVKDGDRVEVLRGIVAGEYVATRGAYVVKLAALSPASFGPGHQH